MLLNIQNQKNIENALNEHFATVGPKLAAKIPGKANIDRKAASECNDKNENIDECNFHLESVTEEHILNNFSHYQKAKLQVQMRYPLNFLNLHVAILLLLSPIS